METPHQIFLNCDYTTYVLESALVCIYHHYWHPFNWNSLFSKWEALYRGTFKDKLLFKWVWLSLLKFNCWKIWLSRNQTIFNHHLIYLEQVVTRAKILLVEHFGVKRLNTFSQQVLEQDEGEWSLQFYLDSSKIEVPYRCPNICWKLQMCPLEL